MTTTIGIDPGTHCGWAVLGDRHEHLASGVWDLKPRRHEGGGMRYVRAGKYLRELLAAYPGAHVYYEEVRRHMGVDAAHVYGGIIAKIGEECESAGRPYAGVPVATVKKLATGKGNADKEKMIAAAKARFKIDIIDDNHADALFIAYAGAV